MPTFTLSDDAPTTVAHGRKHHRRGGSKTSVSSKSSKGNLYGDENGGKADDNSLSYSASSSVQSSSTTGESTDSSFAEIIRLINDRDGDDLLVESPTNNKERPETISGQPSDSHGNDGGGHGVTLFQEANTDYPSRTSPSHSRSPHHPSSSSLSKGKRDEKNMPSSKVGPPRGPIKKNDGKQIWYSQYWMCGFADAFNLSGDAQN